MNVEPPDFERLVWPEQDVLRADHRVVQRQHHVQPNDVCRRRRRVGRDRHLDVCRRRAVGAAAAAGNDGERRERDEQIATHPQAEYTASSPAASGRSAPAADFRAHLSRRASRITSCDGAPLAVGGAVRAGGRGGRRRSRRPSSPAAAPTLRSAVGWTLLWIALSVGYGALVLALARHPGGDRVLHRVAAREVAQLRQPHGVPARLHALQGAARSSATAS